MVRVGSVLVVASLLLACSVRSTSSEASREPVVIIDDGGGDAALPDALPEPSDAGTCSYPPVERGFDWVLGTSGGTSFYRYIPSSPRGVIVMLHGTNGSAANVADAKVESASFLREAATRGYALLVPESDKRTVPRQWSNDTSSSANPDLVRILSLLREMRDLGVPSDTPVFLVGMSQGGGAAGILALLLAQEGVSVKGVAAYCSGATSAFVAPQYTLPTVFTLMANDSVVADAAAIAENAATLSSRGVDVLLFTQAEGRACPGRFARIAGISEAGSAQIFDGLVRAGVLDAEGRVSGGVTAEAMAAAIPPAYATYVDAIEEQLRVIAADHVFAGDRNAATLDFLDSHR